MSRTYSCRDDVIVPAATEACFAVLRDVGTYARWWTLVTAAPVSGGTRLSPGMRFRLTGRRSGRDPVSWVVRVTAVRAPVRLELEYDEGDLLGTTGWELEPAGTGTRVAYVYYAVRPNGAAAADTFVRHGTQFHSLAMREDALSGLVRFFGGDGSDVDDAAWRTRVRRRIAEGAKALG